MNGLQNRNAYTEHPLIAREQTYVLERKLVTIHSEDRDVCSWPHSSMFEITLPQQLLNVQSIRLIESNFPSVNNVFTNSNQNTKLTFNFFKEKVCYFISCLILYIYTVLTTVVLTGIFCFTPIINTLFMKFVVA